MYTKKGGTACAQCNEVDCENDDHPPSVEAWRRSLAGGAGKGGDRLTNEKKIPKIDAPLAIGGTVEAKAKDSSQSREGS